MTATQILEDLVETLEDGAKGFEQAVELLAGGEGATSLVSEMRNFAEQRRRFSAELRELAARNGESIDEDGSAGGAIHRTWMSLKDGATGADAGAILTAAETGEDHAVSEYEDALESDALTGEARDVVARQAQAVKSAHDKVKALAVALDS